MVSLGEILWGWNLQLHKDEVKFAKCAEGLINVQWPHQQAATILLCSDLHLRSRRGDYLQLLDLGVRMGRASEVGVRELRMFMRVASRLIKRQGRHSFSPPDF